MDYDMPDGLHAVLPMPPRPHPETVASLAPLMDDMLIDQDSAPPARPVNSTLQPNPSALVDVGAPARSRRGPRKSGHHRQSAKNNGARPPDRT